MSTFSKSSPLSSPLSSTLLLSSASLAFLNLHYEVTDYGKYGLTKKVLLHRLNGSFTTGSLNGLMGPSGSGKTTLLSALSGKNTSGLSPDSKLFISKTSTTNSYFIQQHVQDTIEGSLTIRQILEYAYQFKNGLKQSAQMKAHIEQVTSKLLLNSSNLFGQHFNRCSGGEQRRVAVAQELMTLSPPSFLFLDEPTTGLDSYAALELIRCLANIAEKSKDSQSQLTIVASIHSPSSELLLHFDKLYVLAKGVCIFSGPPSQLETVLEKQLGFDSLKSSIVGKGIQPIEVVIKIACNDLHSCSQLQTLANHAMETEFVATSTKIELTSMVSLPSGLPNIRKKFSLVDLYLQMCRHARVSFIAQGRILLSQLLLILVSSAIFSTFYNSPAMVFPRGCYTATQNGSTFTGSTCQEKEGMLHDFTLEENINFQILNREDNTFLVMFIWAFMYSRQAAVFRSEHRNRWYSLGVFYWATDIVSSLQLFVFTFPIALTSYFIVSEQAIDDYTINWARLGHFTACIALCLVHSATLGQLVGVAFAGSKDLILVCLCFASTTQLMLNDFFFKSAEITVAGYRVLAEILGVKYITRYLVYTLYGLDRCKVEEGEASWVLEKYDVVDFEQLWPHLLRVLFVNVLLYKATTFALMYLRFRGQFFNRKNAHKKMSKKTDIKQSLMPIDFSSSLLPKKTISLCSTILINSEIKTQKIIQNGTIIAWQNLTLLKTEPLFRMPKSDENKENIETVFLASPEAVLHNLNGSFTFNSLNAIMGMSGAGKTTFLRLLNGQQHQRLSEESKIYVSNKVSISTVFLEQEVGCHLMRGLTAKQCIVYASNLKNAQFAQDKIDHEQIAYKLLDKLSLSNAGPTKVEHLSGGERKRLALALELTSIVMPNLICIDEPTSGLDSNSAINTISTLRNLSLSYPITIVVSIHQPNNELLHLFDTLYVLASGGHAIYSGPPEDIERHLSQLQEASFTKNEHSEYPIETLIKYSSLKVENSLALQQLKNLTFLAATNIKEKDNMLKETILLENTNSRLMTSQIRFSLTSVFFLCKRYFLYMCGYQWKEWLAFTIFSLLYAFNLSFFFDPSIASVSGCLSLESDFNVTNSCSVEGEAQRTLERALSTNLIYTFFFSNIFFLIVILQTPINLVTELPLFFNEHRNRYYSTGSWYLSKLIFELLPILPVIAVYVYIIDIYSQNVGTGRIGSLYWYIFLTMIITTATAQGFAYIIVLAVNQRITLVLVLGTAVLQTMYQLSNVFTSLSTVHYAYQTLSYFVFVRWPLQALMLLQYGFGRCSEKEVQPILYRLNLTDDDYGVAWAWMLINLLFYRGVAFWMLVNKVNDKSFKKNKKDEL